MCASSSRWCSRPPGTGSFRRTTGPRPWSGVEESRPDLIVTDVMMPVLDGLELIERLRSDPATADDPDPGAQLARHGLVPGADAALAKPFRPHEVLATGLALIEGGG